MTEGRQESLDGGTGVSSQTHEASERVWQRGSVGDSGRSSKGCCT